ncbi:MAG: helix-hairpin-helix domain-containing protein [Chitinophagaceae bacterium]|nr:helix-hairpin-helix domain-containing protein [Chitinophagaceae bacterium]
MSRGLKYFLGVALLMLCFNPSFGQKTKKKKLPEQQQTTELPDEIENRLEEMTANNEDENPDDDTYLQDLEYFSRHPLNINTVDRETLQKLNILSPAQIDHFFSYRQMLGKFVSIYELQAIPLWDVATIRKIIPFVGISSAESFSSLKDRFKGGENTLLLRYTRILEKSEGYLRDPNAGKSYYPGSPDKYFLRYKYRFKNKLQYGLTAEKDAGEQFFKGNQKQGFDFYSAHLFARDIGIVKAIAIGDFAVNFGQGLVQWQSLSFSGPSEGLFIKRQGEKLRPYVSAGEVMFNRGAGITLEKNRWQGTAYVSFRSMDATAGSDTLDFVSSIRQSGFHRTQSEIDGQNLLKQFSYGLNLQYSTSRFRIGFNTAQFHFSTPVVKSSELYKKYATPGSFAGNYSVDYSYTLGNAHFFGEVAMDSRQSFATVNGVGISLNRYVDVSLLHRDISMKYLTLYGSAFTQSSTVNNENGFYTGINIKPNNVLRIDAYADVFKFPWLRYRVDAPSVGTEMMFQIYYTPSRQAQFYVRYRSTNKGINQTVDGNKSSVVENISRQTLRAHVIVKVSNAITFRSRVENSWYGSASGFMIYADVIAKPRMSRLSGNARLQYFETDNYDTRIYSYENDVLYSYSIPMVYGKGFRYYLNLRYNLFKDVSLWTRIAQTRYLDRDVIGSGLDKIDGKAKTELKVELYWRF